MRRQTPLGPHRRNPIPNRANGQPVSESAPPAPAPFGQMPADPSLEAATGTLRRCRSAAYYELCWDWQASIGSLVGGVDVVGLICLLTVLSYTYSQGFTFLRNLVSFRSNALLRHFAAKPSSPARVESSIWKRSHAEGVMKSWNATRRERGPSFFRRCVARCRAHRRLPALSIRRSSEV